MPCSLRHREVYCPPKKTQRSIDTLLRSYPRRFPRRLQVEVRQPRSTISQSARQGASVGRL